ncbi:hypothetical protein AAHE18_U032300 [Arachis hypogaea]
MKRKDIFKRIVLNVRHGLKRKGFLTIQTTSQSKMFLYMGNHVKAPIEGIGTYRLVLDTSFHLNLPKTLYVPLMSRNLISVSKLDNCDFSFNGGHSCFNLFKNSNIVD